MMQRYASVAGLRRGSSSRSGCCRPVAVQPVGQRRHAGPEGDRPAADRVAPQQRGGRRARHRGLRADSSCPFDEAGGLALEQMPHRRGRHPVVGRRGPGAPSDPDADRPRVERRHRLPRTSARARSTPPSDDVWAGDRGHRRRPGLVLVPPGVGGPRPARSAGRWRRAAPGPTRPGPDGRWASRSTSGGSRPSNGGTAPAPPGRDAAARRRPGWSSPSTGPTRATGPVLHQRALFIPRGLPAPSTGGRCGRSTASSSARCSATWPRPPSPNRRTPRPRLIAAS